MSKELYLNPLLINRFNEWRSDPNLLGVSDEVVDLFLNLWDNTHGPSRYGENDVQEFGESWDGKERLWFFLILSHLHDLWEDVLASNDLEGRKVYEVAIPYFKWLSNLPEVQDFGGYVGLNPDMIPMIIYNYRDEFENDVGYWKINWAWPGYFFTKDEGRTIPQLFFGKNDYFSFLNWNENPLEVKQ